MSSQRYDERDIMLSGQFSILRHLAQSAVGEVACCNLTSYGTWCCQLSAYAIGRSLQIAESVSGQSKVVAL